MNATQLKKAKKWHSLGLSVREIGEILDVPKSTVHRAINGTDDEPTPAMNGSYGEEYDDELNDIDTPTSREIEALKLKLRLAEKEKESKELELQKARLEANRPTSKTTPTVISTDDARLDRQKYTFLTKFNRLVNKLYKESEGYEWSDEEVVDFYEKLTTLQERIDEFCDEEGIDEEPLRILADLDRLIELFSEYYEQTLGFGGKSVVDIDLEQAIREEIIEMLLDDFDEEVEEDEDEEDDDCDDEEEDEEEDDDEDEEEDDDEPQPRKRNR